MTPDLSYDNQYEGDKRRANIINGMENMYDTYLYIIYTWYVKRGLRHGGLTPALAPHRSVMTEDVGKPRSKMRQYCQRVRQTHRVGLGDHTRGTAITKIYHILPALLMLPAVESGFARVLQ